MKNIDDVLCDLSEGDWRANIRRAAELAKMEEAVRRIVSAAGFAEISCRAVVCENGELRLCAADSSACAVLRQMHSSLLRELQLEFPMVKNLSIIVSREG